MPGRRWRRLLPGGAFSAGGKQGPLPETMGPDALWMSVVCMLKMPMPDSAVLLLARRSPLRQQ